MSNAVKATTIASLESTAKVGMLHFVYRGILCLSGMDSKVHVNPGCELSAVWLIGTMAGSLSQGQVLHHEHVPMIIADAVYGSPDLKNVMVLAGIMWEFKTYIHVVGTDTHELIKRYKQDKKAGLAGATTFSGSGSD